MKNLLFFLFVALIVGATGGYVASFIMLNSQNSENALIKEFYLSQNAVYVSPHSLRVKMDQGINDYTLVDLRSREEYDEEHITGAINIPAYSDRKTSAYGEVGRIVREFSRLPKDKEIVVYCYSIPCMSGKKVGKLLAENGIYVKHLGIGWNEWRHFWNLWNHEYEWSITNVTDYIAKGKELGAPKIRNITSTCSAEGGC